MELILAAKDGHEIRQMSDASIDLEIGAETNDFEMTISRDDWTGDISFGSRIYSPGTEYGGIVRRMSTDTKEDTVSPGGYTWRGMLMMKIIEPKSGQAYRTVSGELNSVLKSMVEPEFDGLFVVATENTGMTVTNYQFDRYCTLLEGLQKMLGSVGYKLKLEYIQRENGSSGYVAVSAVEIKDYSAEIELSEDDRLHFQAAEKRDGVNHLICLGKGELTDRVVIHLYAQKDGSIGKTRYYTGIDEITEVYENTSGETEKLEENGRKKLQELMNARSFSMDVSELGIDISIGDIVGGRDYLTGIYVKKPIISKIWKIDDEGTESVEYEIEGED